MYCPRAQIDVEFRVLFSVSVLRQTQVAIPLVFPRLRLPQHRDRDQSSASAGLFRASETPHRSVPVNSRVNSRLISCRNKIQAATSVPGLIDAVEETAERKALDLQRFVSGFEPGNNPQAGFGDSEQCSNVFHNARFAASSTGGAVTLIFNARL